MSKNELSVDEFIIHLKIVADHLDAISKVGIDHDLILHAISGLNSSYNSFVSFFTMQYSISSFDEFHSQLWTYERHLEQ